MLTLGIIETDTEGRVGPSAVVARGPGPGGAGHPPPSDAAPAAGR